MRTDAVSMIGVTAHWKCAACDRKTVTHQLVAASDPALDLPPGWRQRKGLIYCPDSIAENEKTTITFKDNPIR
jgi:hypothetical protein